jgi:hypothetical protein
MRAAKILASPMGEAGGTGRRDCPGFTASAYSFSPKITIKAR